MTETRIRELEAELTHAFRQCDEAYGELFHAIETMQRQVLALLRTLGLETGAPPEPGCVGATAWCQDALRDVILPEIERLTAARRDLATIAALVPRGA